MIRRPASLFLPRPRLPLSVAPVRLRALRSRRGLLIFVTRGALRRAAARAGD